MEGITYIVFVRVFKDLLFQKSYETGLADHRLFYFSVSLNVTLLSLMLSLYHFNYVLFFFLLSEFMSCLV